MQKEEMIMARRILVPFNSDLRFKDTISVIAEAAKPGMSVVILIRYPVDAWAELRDHWITTESARDAMRAGRKIMERHSWDGQRALAEEMVAPWRYALEKIGVNVTVDVYAGSLASVVETYGRGDEISLVVRAQNDLPIIGFLHTPIAFIGRKNSAQPGAGFRLGLLSFDGITKAKNDMQLQTRGV
jgi:hypothetical protein